HYWLGNSRDRFLYEGKDEASSKTPDYLIHKSRIIRFDGILLSDSFMLSNSGWGLSIVESTYPYFKQWEKALASIAEIIDTASILTYSLQGLSDLIRDEDSNGLTERFKSIKLMLSVFNGIALDSASEKIDYVTRSFNGLRDIADAYRDALMGASGLPHNVFLGDSAGGLGSTGDLEENTFASMIASHQTTRYLPAISYLDRLIFLAKDGPTNGTIPDGMLVEFIPWKEETVAEKQQNRSSDITTLATAAQSGFITPEEARTVLGNPRWWPQLQLDEKEWAKQKAAQEAESASPQEADPYGDYSGIDVPASEDMSEEFVPDPDQNIVQDSIYSDIDFRIPEKIKPFLNKDELARKILTNKLSISPDQVKAIARQLRKKRGRPTIVSKWISKLASEIDDAEIRTDSSLIDIEAELIKAIVPNLSKDISKIQDRIGRIVGASRGESDTQKYTDLSTELAKLDVNTAGIEKTLYQGFLLAELAGRLDLINQIGDTL
ncbi:MAG: anti-CBASS protein Acb1 family protein, partial [Microcoleaceae cyanobacterium]